ncbi:uncharacterized protein [Euphorbia lathyris]|uniref:uncharacterized protein n=1 Tax=Euphorbia lathyris TaxID=212925 RepID=UPI003313DA60
MAREVDGDENGAFCSAGGLRNNDNNGFLNQENSENGDFVLDNYESTEAANVRILETGKVRDNQMADVLLSLRPLGLKLSVSSVVANKGVESKYPPKFEEYSSQPASEKLKAANFEATSIKIGKWERIKKNEGDITAKCYFAKKKLVWEFLQGNLKSKIEIQWNEIIGLQVDLQENKPGILEIELNKAPDFFEEIDPQPRKHTIWRVTSDFTGGAASTFRRHSIVFPPGILDKHYEKLLQCDQRLYGLTRKPFPSLATQYFDQNFHKYLNFASDASNFNLGFQFNFSSIPPPIMATHPPPPLPPLFNETTSPVSVMDFSPSNEHITSNINVFDHTRMCSIPREVPPTPPFLPELLSYQDYSRISGHGTHYQDPNMVNCLGSNIDQLLSENQGAQGLIGRQFVGEFSGQNTFYGQDQRDNGSYFGELGQQAFYGSGNQEIGGEVAIYEQDPMVQQAWDNLIDPRADNFDQEDMDINRWRR